LHCCIHKAQIYFVFLRWSKCVVKAEDLLQAFGFGNGSCGLADVLATVRWLIVFL